MLEQKSFESKNVDVGHKNVETNGNLGTSFLYSMKSKEPSISTAPIISPRKQTFEIENKINSTNKVLVHYHQNLEKANDLENHNKLILTADSTDFTS
ncbi:13078_t:CDS:2 [Entrophospora sp. SA101]|nr:13078_t:CDS:2 [Entrophospora sp. SA101]